MSHKGLVGDILWAGAYAAGGDKENTLAWLQKAATHHTSGLNFELRNPIYDFVRSDQRYIEMMRGIGVPP